MKSIGENIRKRRISLGLTQQELADALGLKTRSSISKIEKAGGAISGWQLERIAAALNTTPGILAGEKDVSDSVSTSSGMNEAGSGSAFSEAFPGDSGNPKKEQRIRKKIAAVILAGGKYRVNKYRIPYQFVSVRGKPIVIYTMEAYQRHPLVDEIYVVCLSGWEDFLTAYAGQYHITKFKGIISAGERGSQSVKNAVDFLLPSYRKQDILILQESTRPLTDNETISNAIRCCNENGSAVTFTHLEDTTPFLLDSGSGEVTPVDAYKLITIQSPEVYTAGVLKDAFDEAARTGRALTETQCSVFMHNLGRKLSFCEGSHNNLRIVYEDDLKLFEALL